MLDLGIQKGNKNDPTQNYKSEYLSQLGYGEEITGEIFIGELKTKEIKSKEVHEFYVIITDNKNEKKWICGLITSAYFDDDVAKIYGEKGGRIYQLIDSLSHTLNNTKLNELESYSVVFDTFRETVNEQVETVTAKTVKPSNPNARSPNIEIINAVKVTEDPAPEKEVESEAEKPEVGYKPKMMAYDDEQARTWIKLVIDEIGSSVPDRIVEEAKKNMDKWELTQEDILRIKLQLANDEKKKNMQT